MDLAELVVRLKADVSEYMSDMDKVKGGSDGVTKATGGMSSGLAKLGSVVSGGAIVGGLSAAVMETVGSLSEMNRMQTQTEAVLKSTGGAAGVTGDEILNMASDLESLTGIDQNAIQNGENLLLTFTNIKNGVGEGNDIFTQATQIMTDMGVALGTDAAGSAVQLGKALNDPIAGISALSRVGVTFTDEQKNMIKGMVESGDMMGAQKVILNELNKEFGGSAEAYGNSMPGAIARAKEAFAGLMEGALQPLVPIVITVSSFVGKLAGWFDKLPGPVKTFIIVGGILTGVIAGLAMVMAPLITSVMAMNVALGPILLIVLAVVAAIAAVVAIVMVCIKYHEQIREALITAWNAIKDAMITAWDAIKAAFDAVWGSLQTAWQAVIDWLTGIPDAVIGFFKDSGKWLYEHGKAIITGCYDGIREIWESVMGWLGELYGKVVAFFADSVSWLYEHGKSIITGAYNGLKEIWAAVSAWFGQRADNIKANFAAAGTWLYEHGKSIITGAYNGLKEIWTTVEGWFGGLGGKVTGFFSDAGTWLYDIGKSIIQGIWDGMLAVWKKVTEWVSGIGSWIKEHKGPIQKDAVLLYAEGQAIMEGLGKGMESRMGALQRTLSGFSDSLASPVNVSYRAEGASRSSEGSSASWGSPRAVTNHNQFLVSGLDELNTARTISKHLAGMCA